MHTKNNSTMVRTLSFSYVQVDYELRNCNIRNEPHINFTLHPHSSLIEAWTFEQSNNWPLIHLRTIESTVNGGRSVKLSSLSFLVNEEAKRFAISVLVGELGADQKTKEAIADEIISQSDKNFRNMGGFGMGDEMFNWRVTLKIYVSSVYILDEDDIDDNEVIARLIDDDEEHGEMSSSSWNVMIPAAKAVIEGLEKVMMNVGDFGEMIGCVICLEDIKEGTAVSRLNCLHAFHTDCIRAWLERSHYCPLCRFALPDVTSNSCN